VIALFTVIFKTFLPTLEFDLYCCERWEHSVRLVLLSPFEILYVGKGLGYNHKILISTFELLLKLIYPP